MLETCFFVFVTHLFVFVVSKDKDAYTIFIGYNQILRPKKASKFGLFKNVKSKCSFLNILNNINNRTIKKSEMNSTRPFYPIFDTQHFICEKKDYFTGVPRGLMGPKNLFKKSTDVTKLF